MATITDAAIRAAVRSVKTTGKPVMLKDPGPRGAGRLALQVRPSAGAPTAEWYAIYYRQGRRVQAKIGDYPQTTLSAARDEFGQGFGPAIKAGDDPRAARREAKRQRAQAGSVKALFRAYVDNMKAAGRKSWREYEKALLDSNYAAAAALGEDRRASDVTPGDVATMLGSVYRRGARSHADHLRSYMHAAFEWGLKADNDYRQRSDQDVMWGLSSNPVAGVPRDNGASQAGERHLSPAELKSFWDWLAAKEGHAARVLQLQILTGQRVQMLAAIGPGHFSERQRTLEWSSEEVKRARPHVLPLPTMAVSLIKGLPVSNGVGLYFPQPHVRRSHGGRHRPVTHFTVADLCREYCGRKGYKGEPFSPRDIRRTWKTLAGMAGISKEMRDRLQHHAMRDVGSMHYDKYDYLTEKRAAMKRWSDWIGRVMTKKAGGKVALLRNTAQ